jgi:hypothetical protein
MAASGAATYGAGARPRRHRREPFPGPTVPAGGAAPSSRSRRSGDEPTSGTAPAGAPWAAPWAARAAGDRRPHPLEGERAARVEAQAREVIAQLAADFTARDQLYRRLDTVLWSQYTLNIPDAYRATTLELRSPMQLNIAQTIAASLSVNPQQIGFEPVGESGRAQANSELREHFFEASWRRQEQDAGRQLLRLFLWALVTKGEGILKTIERSARAWGGPHGYYAYAHQRSRYHSSREADREYDKDTDAYKQTAPYPIASTDVQPDTFTYFRTPDGFSHCVETLEVPYVWALDKFGAALDGTGKVLGPQHASYGLPRSQWAGAMSGQRTLTCYECWYPTYAVYLLAGPGQAAGGSSSQRRVEGTLVRVFRHGYGSADGRSLRGPYFHALGITTGERLPERAGLSVLYPFLSLFQALDTALSIQSNSAYQTGFATYKYTQPPGQSLASALGGPISSVAPFGQDGSERSGVWGEVQKIEPGTIYPYDIGPLDQPRGGVDLDKVIAQIRGFLELALPAVLQGAGSDLSGYALNQKSHQARLSWDPIVQNAQVALGQRVSFESELIEDHIGEKVFAFGSVPIGGASSGAARRRRLFAAPGSRPSAWVGVGPEELGGHHRYMVTLEPDLPTDRVLEVRTHGEMVKAGFESESDAIEALGGDPAAVQRQRLIEASYHAPFVQGPLQQRIAQRLGLYEQQQLQAIGAGPGGVPQMPMGPPIPAGGPPGAPTGLMAAGIGIPPGLPDASSPGFGMPLIPTPSQPGPTGLQGGVPGAPVVPGPPATHTALPGQGPSVAQP